MNLEETIIKNVKTLPESKQMEVLDFVEYLKQKAGKDERKEWKDFALSSAMQGMEDGKSPRSLNDIKGTSAYRKFAKVRGAATVKMTTDEIMALTRDD